MQLQTLDIGQTPIVPPAALPNSESYRSTVCLIGAKDAFHCSFDELGNYPVPEATERESTGNVSYQPLPYAEFATATRSIFAEVLDAEPLTESYALARNGNQMFGKIVFPFRNDTRRGLSIALRSSYDQSISNQVAGGLDTFICANGMLNGEAMFSLRHTAEMPRRIVEHLRDMAGNAMQGARMLSERLDRWASVPMADDMFYAYAGILRGRGIISPTLQSKAIAYWNACTRGELHAEHGDRTLASGFQAVTGALHRAPPQRAFAQFGGADHITEALSHSGGSADTDIPAFTLNIVEV